MHLRLARPLVWLVLLRPTIAEAQEASRDPVVTQCQALDTTSAWRQVARAWDRGRGRRFSGIPHRAAQRIPATRDACADKQQPAGEVNPAELAMLEDRLNVQEGRPQRFGSQLKPPGETTIEYYPIEDVAAVEARRAAAGLVPLVVYSCIIGKRYNRTVATPPA